MNSANGQEAQMETKPQYVPHGKLFTECITERDRLRATITILVAALLDLYACFNNEGELHELFEDQVSVALEKATKALEDAFLAAGRAGANAEVNHPLRKAWERARALLAKDAA